MKLQISVDARGPKQTISRVIRKTRDTRTPLRSCAEIMLRSVMQNFEEQGRPKKWAPLLPATIKRRRKKGRGVQILQDTGTLRQSFQTKSDAKEAVCGTRKVYAPPHQFGYPPGNIPQRIMALHQKEDIEAYMDAFARHVRP